MRKRNIIVLVILLVIGFASITSALVIRGNLRVGINDKDFDVYFSNAIENSIENKRLIKDDTHISFTKDMSLKGETYELEYDVTNGSRNYDANIKINCTESNEYMRVENEFDESKILEATKTRRGVLRIEVVKPYNGSEEETKNIEITCTIVGSALERDVLATDTPADKVRDIATELLSKVNDPNITYYLDGSPTEMFQFNQLATTQLEETIDYRYIGPNPYNYVKFNDEVWRIIGVFNENGEQRIKIIRDSPLANKLSWNNTKVNEWTTSSLNKYLNGEYSESLTEDAKKQIGKSTYYLGATKLYMNLKYSDYYDFERGIEVVSSDRSINTYNFFGLMYPSDYIYTFALGVDNLCYNDGYNCTNSNNRTNSWLYPKDSSEWLLSPVSRSDRTMSAFFIRGGSVDYSIYSPVTDAYSVRPVVYLKPETQLIAGDGSKSNPYIIK